MKPPLMIPVRQTSLNPSRFEIERMVDELTAPAFEKHFDFDPFGPDDKEEDDR